MSSFQIIRTKNLRTIALNEHANPRLGSLCIQNKRFDTPAALWATKSGSVPHLTPENFDESFAELSNVIFYVAFEHFVDLFDKLESVDASVGVHSEKRRKIETDFDFCKFLGIRNSHAVVVGVRDIHKLANMPAFFPSSDSNIKWPTIGAGKDYVTAITNTDNAVKISVEKYKNHLEKYIKPDLVLGMADIFHQKPQKPQKQAINVSKRIKRSVECTADLNALCSAQIGSSYPFVATAVGMDDERGRTYSSEQIANLKSACFGVYVPLQQTICQKQDNLANVPTELSKAQKLALSLGKIPDTHLRIVSGIASMEDAALALAKGADLVTTEFLEGLANDGKAIVLKAPSDNVAGSSWISLEPDISSTGNGAWHYKLVALNDPEFFADRGVLADGCQCKACSSRYSKSYIHHLFSTSEMLGPVLLMQHNIFTFDIFIKEFRNTFQNS